MARAARSLDVLLSQINAFAPRRSKVSDGGIADAAHMKKGTSDHIPDRFGIFHARDFTHDPSGGFDSYAFADRILRAQDPRLKYVISNGRIGSGPRGPQPGVWRPYSGSNRHDHHVHVSVNDDNGDQTQAWAGVVPAATPKPKPKPPLYAGKGPAFPLPKGYYFGPRSGPVQSVSGYAGRGDGLGVWQARMKQRGWSIQVTARYDAATEKVARAFQQQCGRGITGRIGPDEWWDAWNVEVTR